MPERSISIFDQSTFLAASNYKLNITIKEIYLHGSAAPTKVLTPIITISTPVLKFSKSATPDSIPSGKFPVNSILNGAPF